MATKPILKVNYSAENSSEEIRPELRQSWEKSCKEMVSRRMSRDRMWSQLYLFEQWLWLEGKRYSMSCTTDKNMPPGDSWTGSFYPSNHKNYFLFTDDIRICYFSNTIKIQGEIGMDGMLYLDLKELQYSIDSLVVHEVMEQ